MPGKSIFYEVIPKQPRILRETADHILKNLLSFNDINDQNVVWTKDFWIDKIHT